MHAGWRASALLSTYLELASVTLESSRSPGLGGEVMLKRPVLPSDCLCPAPVGVTSPCFGSPLSECLSLCFPGSGLWFLILLVWLRGHRFCLLNLKELSLPSHLSFSPRLQILLLCPLLPSLLPSLLPGRPSLTLQTAEIPG